MSKETKIKEAEKAIVDLGLGEANQIELEDLDDKRSMVIYGGHFIIGIYDFDCHTFVD